MKASDGVTINLRDDQAILVVAALKVWMSYIDPNIGNVSAAHKAAARFVTDQAHEVIEAIESARTQDPQDHG